MNENQVKKRNWIKNATIIFLAVMLILTFFSNTIMNYSLPEVAIQYTQSGTISSEVRGSGEITSGEPYNVIVDEARIIQSVRVKSGEEVEAGDILYLLKDQESQALIDARVQLETLQTQYEKTILSGTIDAGIVTSVEAGQSLSISSQQAKMLEARNEVLRIEGLIEEAQKQIDAFNLQIQLTQNAGPDLSAEKTALDNAKATLEKTQASVTAAATTVDTKQTALEKNSITIANSNIIKTSTQAKADYETLKSDNENNGSTTEAEVAAALAYYNEVLSYEEAVSNLNKVNATKATHEAAVTKAQDAYDAKVLAGVDAIVTNLQNQKSLVELNVASLQNDLTKAQEAEADVIQQGQDQIDLTTQYDEIKQLKATISELEASSIGAQITAPVSGTLTTVVYEAGQETMAGENVAVIQPAGDTFTMSYSVTNEQANQVKIGAEATIVNNWYYNNLSARLISIRPDMEDPTKKKILTFELAGDDIIAGQSITLGIGQQSSNFDIIVPNSAIKEDNNGTFVLVVESKSSPVGTRYTAKRIDVEVLASDDTKSAVLGELSGWGDAIITTTNKPVEAGELVRLAES